MTTLESPNGSPRWSPNSHTLTFSSSDAGDWNTYVIEADGGVPQRLTQEPSDDYYATWSPDGRWVYFVSDRSGGLQIWKIPPEGGQAAQVTKNGGAVSAVSLDGDYLYYSKQASGSGIWRMPVDGGEELQVVRELVERDEWALSRTGIYFATSEQILTGRTEEYTIRFLDFASGRVTEFFAEAGPSQHRWLAVSPDEEWVLFGRWPASQSELMLMENFR